MKGIVVLISWLCLFAEVARADWEEALLEAQSQCAVFVVVGKVTEITTNYHPNLGTVAQGTIQVQRHLKGIAEVRTIKVEFQFPSLLEIRPDTEDVIWFIRNRLENGHYLVVDWKWGQTSLGMIQSALSRSDKTTRIVGLPPPVVGDEAISLTLAADNGQGQGTTTKKVPAGQFIGLLAQFENHGSLTHAVMPCLDGSEEHWRYPYYDLEIKGADGKPVINPQRSPRCSHTNPLRLMDIVPLALGEVFRTSPPPLLAGLPSGKYSLRLVYVAKRDANSLGVRSEPEDKSVQERVKTVWEGTLQSNWIEIEVERSNINHL